MDWINLVKRRKELSSLQFKESDVTYQVWELGRVLARISEVCWRIRTSLDGNGEESISNLTKRAESLSISLQSLYKRLGADPSNILGNEEDLKNNIEHLIVKLKKVTKRTKWDHIQQDTEQLRTIIMSELRSISVHLCNIFSFSLGLRDLKAKLMYDINSTEIDGLIGDTIEALEKLEKGDKTLASPNLEITPQNLKIVKLRLEGIRKHLSELRTYAQKSKIEFKEQIEERCNMWTNLILDIKNPSDYLTRRKRALNKAIPLIVCYYMVAIPIIIALDVIGNTNSLLDKVAEFGVIALLAPPLIYLFLWALARIYWWVKDCLIVWSFKFDFRFKGGRED